MDAVAEVKKYTPRVNFICPVNDEEQFQSVLMASLQHNRFKSLTKVVNAASAAHAFNEVVVKHPPGDITVLVHQDVYLPPQWTDRMEAIFDNLRFGVAGCVGCAGPLLYADVFPNPQSYLGVYVDQLPMKVDSLDELILVFPSNTQIRLDPDLGWHMYGADACVKAKKLGQDALVIRNRVTHCSRRTGIGPDVYRSAEIFRSKNPGPIKTTALRIDEDGSIH